jgi:hypothetical protein
MVTISYVQYSVPSFACSIPSLPRFEAQPRASAGLSNRQIQQIRLLPYVRTATEESDCCAICLNEFEDGESLRSLWCSHKFHPRCIDIWLTDHSRCPLCQQSVLQGGQQGEPNFSPVLIPSNAVEMTTMNAQIRTEERPMHEASRTNEFNGIFSSDNAQHISIVEVAQSEPPQSPTSKPTSKLAL